MIHYFLFKLALDYNDDMLLPIFRHYTDERDPQDRIILDKGPVGRFTTGVGLHAHLPN